MVPLTTAYYKINDMSSQWRIVQGGQGAGKNWGIAIKLLEYASEKKRTITVVTDTFENLRDGVIKDYRDMFDMTGLNFDDYYHQGNKDMTWGPSTIQFRYVTGHKPQAGKSKRRDILYVNETNKVSYIAIEPYIARTNEICFFDLNPDYETWVHTKILPDERAERIILTHWDNEYCPKGEREYIESRKHLTEWYMVYGKGETGTYSERRVYTFTMTDTIPECAKRLPSGMDFGKNPDPTCLVDHYLDGIDLYLDEIFQEKDLLQEKLEGALRTSIVDRMDGLIIIEVKKLFPIEQFTKGDDFYLYNIKDEDDIVETEEDRAIKLKISEYKNWYIVGDSAGRTELVDLRKHGYNARGVKKKTGSIPTGIARLQSYNIILTKRSTNIKKGMESWLRKVNEKGDIIPEPEGHEPHTLAATRYVMLAKALW